MHGEFVALTLHKTEDYIDKVEYYIKESLGT